MLLQRIMARREEVVFGGASNPPPERSYCLKSTANMPLIALVVVVMMMMMVMVVKIKLLQIKVVFRLVPRATLNVPLICTALNKTIRKISHRVIARRVSKIGRRISKTNPNLANHDYCEDFKHQHMQKVFYLYLSKNSVHDHLAQFLAISCQILADTNIYLPVFTLS